MPRFVFRSKLPMPPLYKTAVASLLLFLILLCCYHLATLPSNDKMNADHSIETYGKIINNTRHHHHHHHRTSKHHHYDRIAGCNCSTSTPTSPFCCQRIIWLAHKFGTVLLRDLFRDFRRARSWQTRIKTRATHKDEAYFLPKLDHRHVMVTRNWLDAIVSGYLYHRAGYECWMDYRGGNREEDQHQDDYSSSYDDVQNWDLDLFFHARQKVPFPPRNNRSLCTYLQEESEEDGIKVIMDIALSRWYKGIVPYYHKVQERWQLNHENHTLFLCYNDLVDPFRQEATFYRILDWMFPGLQIVNQDSGNTGNSSAGTSSNSKGDDEDGDRVMLPLVRMNMPADMKALLQTQQKNHSVYSGGHASTQDPKVRARLKSMVQSFDAQLFNYTIATSNAIFGCQ